jgi:hypothetical protein
MCGPCGAGSLVLLPDFCLPLLLLLLLLLVLPGCRYMAVALNCLNAYWFSQASTAGREGGRAAAAGHSVHFCGPCRFL